MEIWNNFCNDVASCKRRKQKEIEFERGPIKDFLTSLGWTKYGNSHLVEQYPIVFATATHYADFALFLSDTDRPEMIIELKRPINKKRGKDTNQLEDYMTKMECSFGLLVGEKLELYYIDYKQARRIPVLILSIEFIVDNKDAKCLMDLMRKDSYDSDKMRDFCQEQIQLNSVAKYWESDEGKNELYSYMFSKSSLSSSMKDRLRSLLSLEINTRQSQVVEPGQDDDFDDIPVAAEEYDSQKPPKCFAYKVQIKNVDATINYYPSENRFVVVAGSKVRKEPTNSFGNKAAISKRAEVFADKTWSIPQGESVLLLKDVGFMIDTPNIPVQFCTARSTNATTALKAADGRTYAEMFPKGQKVTTEPPLKEAEGAQSTDSDFIGRCISKFKRAIGLPLIKKGRSVYTTTDGKTGYVFRTSKMYPQGQREKYWYAYRRSKEIMDCQQQFVVYGCKDENTIVVLPVSEIEDQLEGLNNTKDANGNPIYWHIVFLKNTDGKMTWLISKPKVHDVDITDRLLR